MPLLFGALMALVCFCIGISKGYSALWSAVAGFFGHMITAAILLLLPDREQGAAEAKWRRDAQAQEIAQLKARVAQLEALLTPPAPPPEKVAQAKAAAGEKPAQAVFPSRRRRALPVLSAASASGGTGICATSAERPFNMKTNDRTRRSMGSAVYLFGRRGQAMENPSGRGGIP